MLPPHPFLFFFFNDTATTEIYTLSLHDALPISRHLTSLHPGHSPLLTYYRQPQIRPYPLNLLRGQPIADRKSTRLNSSHSQISYAVFCLKKKKETMHDELAALQDVAAAPLLVWN